MARAWRGRGAGICLGPQGRAGWAFGKESPPDSGWALGAESPPDSLSVVAELVDPVGLDLARIPVRDLVFVGWAGDDSGLSSGGDPPPPLAVE